MAAHQFAEVTEAVTISYKTWIVTPGVASSKRFPVVTRICRRVEALWQHQTERTVKGKQAGGHTMEKVVFIP